MGVSKKGRRSIEYKNRTYVWWVGMDEDSCDEIWLNIVSEDKSIVLALQGRRRGFLCHQQRQTIPGERRLRALGNI